ncbi:MAG: peptidoglycan DD-metalloendopeptidase family protein [Myxococcaceae bacterium]|nr:peptidoglycan DD-metalloendopeptidase family protein [Myxococcaceae bacterium]MCA3015559.1 peptidoglycan DD-metalloendopeptidase family protein [Myxococcaceae bacterium]
MLPALVVALVLQGSAEDVADERAELTERLEAERKAFEALAFEKRELLALLDTLERLSRDSSQRVAQLERQRARLAQQRLAVTAELERSAAVVAERQRALGPRLLLLYRLSRRDALGVVLESDDFASLVKRQRAVKTLIASDARALEELSVLTRAQALTARRLERLEETSARYVRALRTEQAVSRARLARFSDLLASIGAEQGRMSRVIAELEASEKELATLVGDLAPQATVVGFRARKGALPMPAKGLVEVGFGKVVNPRFNTVTVQKGIDVRAPAGTPVVSVFEGAVVFSGWLKGYGTLVIVDHGGGYHSLYAHLATSEVEVGTVVNEGESLGTVGDTGSLKGAYLYFEIRRQGQAVDPQPWLRPAGDEAP